MLELFNSLPILASFLGGIITFLSPCILPIIPTYMFYMSGSSLSNMENYSRAKTLKNAFLFVFGFSLVFFLLGLAMIGVLHNYFNEPIVRYISGGIVILLGLHFLGLFKLAFLYKTKKLDISRLENIKFLSSIMPFIIGFGFAAGWTPCTGPIIASITMLASVNTSMSVVLLALFNIGLALPFILLAVFLEQGLKLLKKIKKYMKAIEIVSGVFLILVGILIALGAVNNLVTYLQNITGF